MEVTLSCRKQAAKMLFSQYHKGNVTSILSTRNVMWTLGGGGGGGLAPVTFLGEKSWKILIVC